MTREEGEGAGGKLSTAHIRSAHYSHVHAQATTGTRSSRDDTRGHGGTDKTHDGRDSAWSGGHGLAQ